MPRNLRSCLTFVGGFNARIACTFFGCGLIPSLVSMYPRYLVSLAQKFDFFALTFKPLTLSHILHSPLDFHNHGYGVGRKVSVCADMFHCFVFDFVTVVSLAIPLQS